MTCDRCGQHEVIGQCEACEKRLCGRCLMMLDTERPQPNMERGEIRTHTFCVEDFNRFVRGELRS